MRHTPVPSELDSVAGRDFPHRSLILRHTRALLSLVLLTAAIPSARAQETSRKPFAFGISVISTSIDPATAAAQLIGPRSWGMQFDGGVSFANFLYAGLDFGPQFLSDHGTFTQATTGGDKQSTAMLLYFSATAGMRTPPVRLIPGIGATSFGLYGGTSATKGERSIDNCVDCTTQDIKVSAGGFVQPTLLFGEGSSRLRISDRHYLDSKGIRDVISVGLEIGGR
jgi:hypothetical protein